MSRRSQLFDVSSPLLHRLALLLLIRVALVHTNNAALRPGEMIENGLDDFHPDLQCLHPRCDRSANVVNPPRRQYGTLLRLPHFSNDHRVPFLLNF